MTLKSLAPGAADHARVTIRLRSPDGSLQELPLRPMAPPSFEGSLVLGSGFHDLRVIVERPGGAVFALSGFSVAPRLQPPTGAGAALWFVPRGRLDAIPWLDNLSGVLAALAALIVIARLLGKTPVAPPGWRASPAVLPVAAAGALSMPFGAFWDISFHAESGRESFFSAPHLLIYGGILFTLIAVAGSLGLPAGGTWRQHLRSRPEAALAAVALAIQLGSGPFDELWHALFGLDVSVWSPPHALLIAGGVMVSLSLAQLPAGRAGFASLTSRFALLGGALLICEVFLAEFEYPFPDWHISQRRPEWVYPVLFAVFTLLISLVAARATARRGGATLAFLSFIVLRLLVPPFLGAVDREVIPHFSPWILVLVLLALAVDLWARPRATGKPV